MCGSMVSSAADKKREQQYRAESDCRTLQDADEIKRDSSRHGLAKAHAKKKLTSYRRIAGGHR